MGHLLLNISQVSFLSIAQSPAFGGTVSRAEDEELPMRVGFWNPENQEIQILENVPFDLNLTTGF